ncbi:tetratricopeptide repeat protein [Pseudoxanthomonas sp. UTMC 1351]|uniref:O-linked N-acetylglucosamine transferase, SPINDLY family protein n=1 Tax=Pseudoxanthomonas sp. UTMC 1351 TaxID=2695853 RepID=UPI0034CEC340
MDDAEQARSFHQRGDFVAAARHYLIAIDAAPDDLQIRHDYAVLLMQCRREADALPMLESILTASPSRPNTTTVLALCLRAMRDIDRGLKISYRATKLSPGNPLTWLARGSLEMACGDAAAAETSLRRCLSMAPAFGEAWHYLGESLQAQGRWREAAQAYRNAMIEQPSDVMNVAICAELSGQMDIARQGYERMHHLHPERGDCLMRLAQIEAMMCDFEAEQTTSRKLESKLADASLLAHDDIAEVFPLSFLPLSDASKRVALERYARRVTDHVRSFSSPGQAAPRQGIPLRLGYLSPDFGNHAVGSLLRGLFKAHDRDRFQVFGYSLRAYKDEIALHIHEEFDVYRNCQSIRSDQLAKIIHNDGIDALIDLGGYTQGSRPEVLALRPAPLQLGWLGFIHGQQAPWLDGVILDEQLLPKGFQWPYSDRVVYASGFSLPAAPMASGTRDRARFGLPEHVPVLASFNNSYKFNEELLTAWIEILGRAPQAHLLVYLPQHAREGFQRNWSRLGGSSARLHFAEKLPAGEHADRMASCDLFLDAFRYQAGATAIAAAAANLPVLSRVGETPLARLSVSLNRFLGLEDLVCADTAAYIERAAFLANSPESLESLRKEMRCAVQRTGLFDQRRSASAIEDIVIRHLDRKN